MTILYLFQIGTFITVLMGVSWFLSTFFFQALLGKGEGEARVPALHRALPTLAGEEWRGSDFVL